MTSTLLDRHDPIVDDATRRQFLAGLAAAGLLAGCSTVDEETAAEPEPETRTIRHALGETRVPARPERPIGLFHPTFLALLGLGLDPIAADEAALANLEPIRPFLPSGFDLDALETVGPPSELNLEQIAVLRPDLLVSIVQVGEDIYEELSGIAPTVLFDWEGTGAWREHVEVIATALGRQAELQDLKARYTEAVTTAREALPSTDATIAVVRTGGPGTGTYRLDLPSSFAGQILTDVGLRVLDNGNVGELMGTFAELSLERLDALQPADIVVALEYDGAAGQADGLADLAAAPLWQQVPAVARGSVAQASGFVWLGASYPAAVGTLEQLPDAIGPFVR